MAEAVVRKTRRFNFRGSLVIPYGVFMVLFVVFPLLLIFYFAFTDAKGNFTLNNWSTICSEPSNWKVIGLTFLIAAITTVICILIAYPIAYLLSNKNPVPSLKTPLPFLLARFSDHLIKNHFAWCCLIAS